jgi:molybdate transport system substrate-binding protein
MEIFGRDGLRSLLYQRLPLRPIEPLAFRRLESSSDERRLCYCLLRESVSSMQDNAATDRPRGAFRARATCLIAICSLALGCSRRPAPAVLSVAAAADLQFALNDLSRDFRSAHPAVDLRIAYGSSGNFFAQVQNRAPFDVFLSADVEYPRRLVQSGIGTQGSLFVYALGRLVVWVPASSALDPASAVESPAVRHLAIANPEHAPYGRAAEAALRSLGLFDRVRSKLVLGENVSQALEFVQSGAADAGILPLSLALAPPVRQQGRYWEIPATAYPKIEQGGVIVKDSPAARDFRSWLLSERGARVLEKYGFSLPEK